MYSYEDMMRAIELYLGYDQSAAAAINEFGYPNRHTLISEVFAASEGRYESIWTRGARARGSRRRSSQG